MMLGLLTFPTVEEAPVSASYDGVQIVGLDLHRRHTVMVRMTEDGQVLEAVRFANDRRMLADQIERAGHRPEVVLEASYGWYWAADALAEAGASVHLAHPLGVKGFAYRRVKNDVRDATDLADLLRMGRLPHAYIAPPETRELRELVRHRHKLRGSCSSYRAQVHALLAKNGVQPWCSDLFGVDGRDRLARLSLPAVFADRLASQLRIIDLLEQEIDTAEKAVAERLRHHPGYRAVQTVPGVGPVLGAVFVAELGDVHRFRSAARLVSWAGLTPRHYESDRTVRRGHITKQGSRLVRWAAVEAIQRAPKSSPPRQLQDRILARRGQPAKQIARVAAARVLLELVYYALRDGHVRRLQPDLARAA
jgi:transposase